MELSQGKYYADNFKIDGAYILATISSGSQLDKAIRYSVFKFRYQSTSPVIQGVFEKCQMEKTKFYFKN